MSKPLTPYDRWLSGTNQNSIPANDNSLRDEIFNTDGVADDVSAQPGSPSDGDWYIVPDGATGAQWSEFDADSVAIFYGGTWYEFVPADGNIVTVSGDFLIYDAATGWEAVTIPASAAAEDVAYDNATSGLSADNVQDAIDELAAGSGSAPTAYTIITEASAFTATPGTHDGLFRYIRAGGNVTFNSSQAYTAGMVFNIRATGAVTLVGAGVTLTPPAGGTLGMTAGMSVQVVMTSSTAGDVIGQTVAA